MTSAAAARLLGASIPNQDAVALSDEDGSITYRELSARVERVCRRLQSDGLTRDARIVYFGRASIESVVAMLAVQKANGIFVPINPKYGQEEISHILADCDAGEFWFEEQPKFLDALKASNARPHSLRARSLKAVMSTASSSSSNEGEQTDSWPDDNDTALLIYTSGTTGRSKGVALSYRAIFENIFSLTSSWGFHENDRLVLQLPLFHVHGLCIGLYGTLLHGMTALLSKKFDARNVVDAFAEDGATVFMGVPTMYALLLEYLDANPGAAEALAKARLFTSGSAPLPDRHFQRFASLTGCRILERYGMSETLLTLSNPYDGERRPGTVGVPVKGCFCRLVNDEGDQVEDGELGELWVKSNGMMTHYWRQPETTTESFTDGWFRTGDVAKRSADGYFTLVGRKSTDIIKSGGFKISTREIEEVLSRHPDIRELAVVGLPDPVWGEIVAAAIVPREPAHQRSSAQWLTELQARCEDALADYKRPRIVFIREHLPRNALGKLQKKILQVELQKEKGPVT